MSMISGHHRAIDRPLAIQYSVMTRVTNQTCPSAIVSFHRDELGDWFARLACGHHQHMRHQPPWINRPWVETEAGRRSMIEKVLVCKKCAQGLPADPVPLE